MLKSKHYIWRKNNYIFGYHKWHLFLITQLNCHTVTKEPFKRKNATKKNCDFAVVTKEPVYRKNANK